MRKTRTNFSTSFAKLAAEEEAFFGSNFLCPVIKNHPLRVKLGGVVLNLKITAPKTRIEYEGWGIFKATTISAARYVREASRGEQAQYLKLFPIVRLILCARDEEQWMALAANSGDSRFHIRGLVPVRFAKDLQTFDTIQTRFDGKNFWFDRIDSSSSRKNAAFLRDSLILETDADSVAISGLTKEEKRAYAIAFLREIENKKDKNEERIKLAIERAGAEYRSYVERGSSYMVEYRVDGALHHSVVEKDTLEVQSAGICLSGGDRAFDLQSLVGVLREGERLHRIVRVNPRDDEDDYDD
jgi:hypothetical protein